MRHKQGLAEAALERGEPLIAGLYSRVSKDPAGTGRSVEGQDEANLAACHAHNWHLPEGGVYSDNDRSASRFATKTRPDWTQLRDDVAAGRRHVVVLWEVSRGDRDDLGWITFLHMCRRLGVWIHITSHGHTYDVRKRRDYKTLAEEGLDSADESEKTSTRILRDVERNARQGRPHGAVTYGYRREYEVDVRGRRHIKAQLPDTTPRVAVDSDGREVTYTPAGIVEEICRRVLAGEDRRGVAVDLNGRGIPSPRNSPSGWWDSTVRDIALNPAYAGLRVFRGEVIGPAAWPALISVADHHALVARLTDPSRRTNKDSTIAHLGSGLFVCGVCGRVVRVVKRSGGGPPARSYVCLPPRPAKRRPPQVERRKVTEAEVAELRGLGRREQTARILDLSEQGVSQASVARALKVAESALSQRLKVERQRRGIVKPARPADPQAGFHVSPEKTGVDTYVQMAVWARLARPDIAALLAEDTEADKRMAALAGEIAEKQARLDAARDGYAATGRPSLETLNRVEAQLAPEIARARARMNEARIGPVLAGLVLPSAEEIEAEWWRRSLPERREVIRVLVERVELLPVRNKRSFRVEEAVRIMWRQPHR